MSARVLFIGLDAAEPGLLRAGIAAGRLPNLRALTSAGMSGSLGNCMLTLPGAVWPEIVSGVSCGTLPHSSSAPDRHRVRGAEAADSRGRGRRPDVLGCGERAGSPRGRRGPSAHAAVGVAQRRAGRGVPPTRSSLRRPAIHPRSSRNSSAGTGTTPCRRAITTAEPPPPTSACSTTCSPGSNARPACCSICCSVTSGTCSPARSPSRTAWGTGAGATAIRRTGATARRAARAHRRGGYRLCQARRRRRPAHRRSERHQHHRAGESRHGAG